MVADAAELACMRCMCTGSSADCTASRTCCAPTFVSTFLPEGSPYTRAYSEGREVASARGYWVSEAVWAVKAGVRVALAAAADNQLEGT